MRRLGNRSAQAGEGTLLVAIAVIVLAIAGIFGSYFINQMRIQLNETNPNVTEATQVMVDGEQKFRTSIDGSTLIIAGIMIIGSGVLAFMLPTHFAFIVIGLILLPLFVYGGHILSSYVTDFTTQSVLNTTAIQYTNTQLVISNLPTIMLISDLIFIIAMFVKVRMGGE